MVYEEVRMKRNSCRKGEIKSCRRPIRRMKEKKKEFFEEEESIVNGIRVYFSERIIHRQHQHYGAQNRS